MSTPSFAELGVSDAVCDALSRRGITEPFPVQEPRDRRRARRSRRARQIADRLGKTLAFGIPIVDRIDADGPRPAALVLAPTRELATQIVDELRDVARMPARCGSRPSTAASGSHKQAADAARSHIVVATPGRLEDLLQRRAISLDASPHPRARRGRPHARHGLPPGGRPHRGPLPALAPDALLLGDARRPRRQVAGAYTTDAVVHDAAAPPGTARRARSSTASSRSTERPRRGAGRGARRGARPRARVRADQARRRPPRQAPRRARRRGRRDPRQQVPAPARAGARTLRVRPCRHAGRHRRRRPRHRRAGHLARHQLRPARRPRHLRAPRRANRSRRPSGRRDHARRGVASSRRPRARGTWGSRHSLVARPTAHAPVSARPPRRTHALASGAAGARSGLRGSPSELRAHCPSLPPVAAGARRGRKARVPRPRAPRRRRVPVRTATISGRLDGNRDRRTR